MKKRLFSALMLASVLSFQSCDNENTVNPEPTLGVATITGTVKAELDETNNQLETVPAGTVIMARINTEDLVLNNEDVDYANKYYETTTNADGEYTFEIDAASKDVTVEIRPQDFKHNVKDFGPEHTEETPQIIEEEQTFNGSNFNVTVYKGGKFIRDFNYSSGN